VTRRERARWLGGGREITPPEKAAIIAAGAWLADAHFSRPPQAESGLGPRRERNFSPPRARGDCVSLSRRSRRASLRLPFPHPCLSSPPPLSRRQKRSRCDAMTVVSLRRGPRRRGGPTEMRPRPSRSHVTTARAAGRRRDARSGARSSPKSD